MGNFMVGKYLVCWRNLRLVKFKYSEGEGERLRLIRLVDIMVRN